MSKKQKGSYVDLSRQRESNCRYNLVWGERSNGKTYGILDEGLVDYAEKGDELALIRRWAEDFVGENSAKTAFNTLECNGEGVNRIAEIFHGEYDCVVYAKGDYYLGKRDPDTGKPQLSGKIVAHAFVLNTPERYKGGSWPKIKTVLFDEFIADRGRYIVGEFRNFTNILSSIIRQRDDVVIWMAGNTQRMSRFNPYFDEMGLHRAKDLQKGQLEVYEYGDSGLRVSTFYSDNPAGKKASDVYFAFDNPALKMIKSGEWELDIYPHAPKGLKWKPKHVSFSFFIDFDGSIYQADCISISGSQFIYIHDKTTPIKDPDHDLIFSREWDPRPNWRRSLVARPVLPVEKKIAMFFTMQKVFYQDNSVGDSVASYLQWCRTSA